MSSKLMIKLPGIYHTAEEHLKHYKIYRKFILYEAFVRAVKIEEFLLSYVITNIVKRYGINLNHGALRADLRVHMWCYFLIVVETVLVFPVLIKAYSTADYPRGEGGDGLRIEKEEGDRWEERGNGDEKRTEEEEERSDEKRGLEVGEDREGTVIENVAS